MEVSSRENQPYGVFPSKSSAFLVIGTLITVIPVTLMLWLGNTAFAFINGDNTDSREETISPGKLLIAVLVPIAFAIHGYRRASVNFSGAAVGIFVGFTLALSSYPFLGCLIAFFISGSQATKFRSEIKKKFEYDFKPGGNRNWIQVLCNGGPATFLALVYLLDCGAGELPVDFDTNYHASWLAMSVLGSFAAACGDTWSSELGSVMSYGLPVLITNLKPVPKGTNGGVSWFGIFFSFVGGMIIGVAYYLTLIYTVDDTLLERAPAQWPVIFIGGISGFIGSLIDSFIGATLQYSGLQEKTRIVVEHPGKEIKHISGRDILDNHSVNLITNILLAILTPKIANSLWI